MRLNFVSTYSGEDQNTSIKLLEADKKRTVWAIEQNEMMLGILKEKAEHNKLVESQLKIIKEDICRLDGCPNQYFEAVTMVNVFYSLEDKEECLRQIHRILRPNGILVLSTSHEETDLDHLFNKLQSNLIDKGLFNDTKDSFLDARNTNRQMEELIKGETKDTIKNMLQKNNFKITEWHEREYADAVVIVKAVKIETNGH